MKSCVVLESERLGYGSVELRCPGAPLAIGGGVTAVVGPNGSGKTTLGLVLSKGRWAYGNRLRFAKDDVRVKFLEFTDIHTLTGVFVDSHTQRLNSTFNDFVPTVEEAFGEPDEHWRELCRQFALTGVEGKRLNFLSSGETRKLLLVNALHSRPDMLVLDNPYIGLDARARGELDTALQALQIPVVMLLADPKDVPGYAEGVIYINNKIVGSRPAATRPLAVTLSPGRSRPRPYNDFSVAFSIKNGHVRYGQHEVISGLNWTVRCGERWALTGPNGSGKSLLLSMIFGDHPQAYANDITLFDRQRGTGETVWEIKDRISYLCPEEQLYFRSPEPVRAIVARGLRGMMHRFEPLTEEELQEADRWLSLLNISHLADRKFDTLSSGEQRLVLLARALIKQPDLLILDEPLHGLDAENKERARRLIDAMPGTLIFVSHYDSEIPESVTLTQRLGANQEQCKIQDPHRP